MSTLKRQDRLNIERKGVSYILGLLLYMYDDITLEDIQIITDLNLQFKGIDYILNNDIKVDSKFHIKPSKKQELTSTGVDAISIEIRTRKGIDGWGINANKETDIIIDYIQDTAIYIIDSWALREYMRVNYFKYPVWYSQEGLEEYRGVSIQDLLDNNIILGYTTDSSEMALINEYAKDIRSSNYYKTDISKQINLLS